ncbi:MAG TPA: isoprenylcysteine carboxylmethyltransferase family protein [Nitrososphaerales archaeon]|nr:isoprenylcysteine carboxylmethyltransferase family protein [Nitrososphaerales archaeon]
MTESNVNPLHIPIPWIYAIAYLLGVALQFLSPIGVGSGAAFETLLLVGFLLLALGGSVAAWALRIFGSVHTTTVPSEGSTTLVTWGPYRFSRNPMYLGLLLFFIGISFVSLSLWSIIPLLAVVCYLNWVEIPGEERQLAGAFGEAYEDYRRRVRRWM